MKYYKVKISGKPAYVVKFSDLNAILEDMRSMELGQKITVSVVELTDKEYLAMSIYPNPKNV